MIKSNDYFDDLFALRIVVMLETKPQSNKYTQIMLTEEKFKKFSDFMFNLLEPNDEEVLVISNEYVEEIEMPDSIKVWYTQEEINNSTEE